MVKRRGRKRGRRVAKMKRYRAVNPKHVSMKFRLPIKLSTNVGGLMTGTINCNSLTRFWQNNTGGYESLLEVQNAINLFDMYRVRAIKIEGTPLYAQSDYTKLNPTTTGANILAPNPNSVLCYDIDNSGRLSNFNAMVTRDHKHQFSVFKKLKHYQPIVKAKQTAAGQATFSMAGGWNNLQSESDNQQGIIDFQSDNVFILNGDSATPLANAPLMNLVITAYVQLKFRQ